MTDKSAVDKNGTPVSIRRLTVPVLLVLAVLAFTVQVVARFAYEQGTQTEKHAARDTTMRELALNVANLTVAVQDLRTDLHATNKQLEMFVVQLRELNGDKIRVPELRKE
jgi:hypothetical protein